MQKFRQNKKTIITVIIAVVIAVFISVGSCYVLAESLINSKDVVYEDNSNLVAENVQDAIDGTCSKIDTRLSDIEDKLYNIQRLTGSKSFSSSTNWTYTGISITFPAKSYCSVSLIASYSSSYPQGLELCYDETGKNNCVSMSSNEYAWNKSITFSDYSSSSTTYYVLAKYNRDGSTEGITYRGFCATKYK